MVVGREVEPMKAASTVLEAGMETWVPGLLVLGVAIVAWKQQEVWH